MKHLTCSIVLVALLSVADLHSQASRGVVALGGSLSYTRTESLPREVVSLLGAPAYTEGYEQTRLSILPRIGFFLRENVAIGLSMGYKKTAFVFDDTGDEYGEKETITFPRLVVEPYGRTYKKLSEDAALFIDGALHFEKGTDTDRHEVHPDVYRKEKVKVTEWGFMLRPGFSYRITDRIALQITIGRLAYTTLTAEGGESEIETTNDSFGADFSLSKASVGVEWYLR